MKGKICLVTGGTSGVGLATAAGLARLGATVVILSRGPERGETAVREIQERSGSTNIELMTADLSIQGSIRDFAKRFKSKHRQLHVLANCAGAVFYKRQETPEGIEATWAVDYLSHFLLTGLLLDVLKISAPARVITVAGGPAVIRRARIDFNDIQLAKSYNGIRAACQAALARLLFTRELARRLEGSGVTANAFHPGLVRSNLTRNLPHIMHLLASMVQPLLSRECDTSVYLASSPEVEGTSGRYYFKKKVVDSGLRRDDERTSEKLWRISEEMTNLRS